MTPDLSFLMAVAHGDVSRVRIRVRGSYYVTLFFDLPFFHNVIVFDW